MADAGTVLSEWATWAAAMIGTAAGAFVVRRGLQAGAADKADANKVGAIAALQPTVQRYTDDVLVQTLAALRVSVERLTDLLERQEREREQDERDELREDVRDLVRQVKHLREQSSR